MTCQELEHAYDLYVFGTLDAADRAEIHAELEKHLARDCPVCTAGVEKSRQLAAHLAVSVPDEQPPARLRSAVLQSLGPRRDARSTGAAGVWRWAFAVFATAAAALLIVTVGLREQLHSLEHDRSVLQKSVSTLRDRQHDLVAQAAAYREAMQLMTAPGSRQVTFGAKQPSGKVFLHANGLVLIATEFPKPPQGRTFELWLIAQNRPAPVPAGVFEPGVDGSAVHVWRQPIAVDSIKALAVSDEPPGGVAAPTGKIILTVPVR